MPTDEMAALPGLMTDAEASPGDLERRLADSTRLVFRVSMTVVK